MIGPIDLATRARFGVAALLAAAVTVCAGNAQAQSWGGLYNMDAMLNQPHPFAGHFHPVPPSAVPTPVVQPAVQGTGAAQPQPTVRPAAYPAPAQSEPMVGSSGWSWNDMFSEIRGGVFAHDTGPISANEEGGVDVNGELLFASPKIFSYIWSPRPHIGGSWNSGGHTSQIYAGLTWEWSFWDGWFAGFSLGGMAHDGHLYGGKDGKSEKSLGCRFLFREGIDIGYRFGKHHAIMAHFDHSSNASLCEKNTPDGTADGRHDVVLNEGLESVGIRYGYMF